MKTYSVLSPVDHDLVRYEIGSTIELDDAHGEILIKSGAVELPPVELREVEIAPAKKGR